MKKEINQLIKQLNTSIPLFICNQCHQCSIPCRGHGTPHFKHSSCNEDICTRFLNEKTNSYSRIVKCIEVN